MTRSDLVVSCERGKIGQLNISIPMARMECDHREQGIVENPLTSRQREILWNIGAGISFLQTAQKFGIAEKTVNVHLTDAKNRLVDLGFMPKTLMFTCSIAGSSLFAALSAAEHGLIPAIPVDEQRREEIEFLKRYHRYEERLASES